MWLDVNLPNNLTYKLSMSEVCKYIFIPLLKTIWKIFIKVILEIVISFEMDKNYSCLFQFFPFSFFLTLLFLFEEWDKQSNLCSKYIAEWRGWLSKYSMMWKEFRFERLVLVHRLYFIRHLRTINAYLRQRPPPVKGRGFHQGLCFSTVSH